MHLIAIPLFIAYFLHEKEDQVRESNYELAKKSKTVRLIKNKTLLG